MLKTTTIFLTERGNAPIADKATSILERWKQRCQHLFHPSLCSSLQQPMQRGPLRKFTNSTAQQLLHTLCKRHFKATIKGCIVCITGSLMEHRTPWLAGSLRYYVIVLHSRLIYSLNQLPNFLSTRCFYFLPRMERSSHKQVKPICYLTSRH